MNLRSLPLIGVMSAFLVPFLATTAASAQQIVYVAAPPPVADGARFRGGVGLEGGAFIAPGAFNLGAIGVHGELGAQINNNWGVYAVPRFDVIFGHAGGVAVGAGALAEYTFTDIPISLGAGPEVGALAAIGGSSTSTTATASGVGGAFYGADLHFAVHPVIARISPVRRKALTIGLDLHMLAGAYGVATTTVTTGGSASGSGAAGRFALAPMAYIGYTAF